MSELEIWKDTEGGNDASPPDGAPENMLRSGLNNVIREMMAKLKRGLDVGRWFNPFYHYTVSRVDADTIRVAGFDATHILLADRRVKITDTGGPTSVEGYVVSSNFGDPDTTAEILVDASAAIPVNADKMEVSMAALGRAAFKNFGSAAAEVVLGSDLIASITANVSAKSAALKDYADSFGEADKVPLYDQLGTVGQYDQGTADGEVPLVSDLPTVLGDLAVLDRPRRVYAVASAEWRTETYNAVAIPDLSNLAIPGANGVKEYEIEILIFCNYASGGPIDALNLRVGSLGTIGDPVAHKIPWDGMTAFFDFSAGDPYSWSRTCHAVGWLHRCIITPNDGDKITIELDPDDDYDYVLQGSFVDCREIFWEA